MSVDAAASCGRLHPMGWGAHGEEGRADMLPTKQNIAWAVLALSLLLDRPAQAENWVAVGPVDSALYYDTQTVRTTSDRLIAVWLSNGPARTQTGADGRTDYAILTLVDCKDRKAGSKLSLDGGTPLKGYALSSSMGALIAKLCV